MATKDYFNIKAGQISTEMTKRGLEFHSWNFERQRMLHVGTKNGDVYEKGNAAILRNPIPSFALSQSEYGAAVDAGVKFLRCIPPDKSATYSISLEDFGRYAEPYYNNRYGPQLRCALSHFSKTATTGRRNKLIDTPRQGPGPEFIKPQPAQLPMFDFGIRRDDHGNVWGG